MNYEELSAEYSGEVLILERNHKNKGYYCDGVISINRKLDEQEKNCTLAEELGHHFTSYGDILDLENVTNIKQEDIAKRWAYKKLLPIKVFIQAFERRRLNKFDMIEDYNVTEEFLENCIDDFKRQYGAGTTYKNYTILFEPTLQIIKWL